MTALPGVAIAVALMPPLCTVGFGVGVGFSWTIIQGAGLLFLTNLAAITASAFLVFCIVQMDAPELRVNIDDAIMERASRSRFYRLLENTRFSSRFRPYRQIAMARSHATRGARNAFRATSRVTLSSARRDGRAHGGSRSGANGNAF